MSISKEKLENILKQVIKPARYTGNELNAVYKNFNNVKLKIALCYPDLYEIGMSNFALKILYEIINNQKDFLAERVFLPDIDMQNILLNDNELSLFTLESHNFVKDFDILGITIQSELNFLTALQILKLSKLPLLSSQRKDFPLVIGGGPGIVNPMPLSKFFDLFVIGESDDIIITLLSKISELKEKKFKKTEILEKLNELEWCYIPSINKNKKVKKHTVKDLNNIYHPVKPVVPYLDVTHNRGIIEVSRGCLQGCRFCQPGFFYRPYRERNLSNILKIVNNLYKNTGYDIFTLLSLNITDYSALKELLVILNNYYSDYGVSFSLPSLKINDFTLNLLKEIKCIRKSGLTFALETADIELQKKINKKIDIEKFKDLIIKIAEMGWKRIKIYLIFGFDENHNEIYELKNLIDEIISKLKNKNLYMKFSFQLNPIYKKPLTPLQYEGSLSYEILNKKISIIKSTFFNKNYKRWVEIKWQDLDKAFITMLLSRSDDKISDFLYKIVTETPVIDSDEKSFNKNLWLEIIKKNQFIYKDFFDVSKIIDYGYNENFFEVEYKKYLEGETTENCLSHNCYNCGICNNSIKNIKNTEKIEKYNDLFIKNKRNLNIQYRYKLKFSKVNLMKYISHRDLYIFFSRIFRIANIPLFYTKGFNPRAKIRVIFPLPLIVEGLNEIIEFYTKEPINLNIKEELNKIINNKDLFISEITEVPLKLKPLTNYIKFSEYLVIYNDNTELKIKLEKDKSILKYLESKENSNFPELWNKIKRIIRTNLIFENY